MHITRFTAWLLLSTVLVLSACKKDEEPTTARINGTITLLNTSVWETYSDSGQVQLTVFPPFSLSPPSGWGPVPDGFFGPGVLGGTFPIGAPYNAQDPVVVPYQAGVTSIEYDLELDPGTYSALALGFRHNLVVDANRRTATVGVYWGNPSMVSHGVVLKVPGPGGNAIPIFNFPAPEEFTVNAGDNLKLDFVADFGFLPLWYR